MFGTYIDSRTMAVQNQDETFENFESSFSHLKQYRPLTRLILIKTFLTTKFSKLILHIFQ